MECFSLQMVLPSSQHKRKHTDGKSSYKQETSAIWLGLGHEGNRIIYNNII